VYFVPAFVSRDVSFVSFSAADVAAGSAPTAVDGGSGGGCGGGGGATTGCAPHAARRTPPNNAPKTRLRTIHFA
jgi:hypothetical protein